MGKVEEEGFVIGHAHFTAIHKAAQNNIDIIFSLSIKWKDGQAVEARDVVDYTTMLTQMGLLDQDIMAKAFQSK